MAGDEEAVAALRDSGEDLWVFGYGSILWKNGEVERTAEVPAIVRGYRRRFWQGSPCHRGTPERPGIVVSIYGRSEWKSLDIDTVDHDQFDNDSNPRDEDWIVYGRAFRVTDAYKQIVFDYLVARESGGFDPVCLPLYAPDGTTVVAQRAITFAAPPSTVNFTGFLTHAQIAERILSCVGPSGSNTEYAKRLHETLVADGFPDPHVSAVVRHIDKLQSAEKSSQ